jgi:hypothetical protein
MLQTLFPSAANTPPPHLGPLPLYMSLAPSPRHLKHRRTVTVEAYAREDGLWELEARLTDVKSRDFSLASGVRKKGEPIHDMCLHVVIDKLMNIVEVDAASVAVPYPGQCEEITPAYHQLVGLNLMQGFRRAVRERLGGVAGCTHMTELTSALPTAAVQAFAGEVARTNIRSHSADGSAPGDSKPFPLDRCHALRSDGQVVREFFPDWYRTVAAETPRNP